MRICKKAYSPRIIKIIKDGTELSCCRRHLQRFVALIMYYLFLIRFPM